MNNSKLLNCWAVFPMLSLFNSREIIFLYVRKNKIIRKKCDYSLKNSHHEISSFKLGNHSKYVIRDTKTINWHCNFIL